MELTLENKNQLKHSSTLSFEVDSCLNCPFRYQTEGIMEKVHHCEYHDRILKGAGKTNDLTRVRNYCKVKTVLVTVIESEKAYKLKRGRFDD